MDQSFQEFLNLLRTFQIHNHVVDDNERVDGWFSVKTVLAKVLGSSSNFYERSKSRWNRMFSCCRAPSKEKETSGAVPRCKSRQESWTTARRRSHITKRAPRHPSPRITFSHHLTCLLNEYIGREMVVPLPEILSEWWQSLSNAAASFVGPLNFRAAGKF